MKQESISWRHTHLDPKKLLYENFVGLKAVIQMAKPEVIIQKDLETDELHSVKVARNSRQCAMVASGSESRLCPPQNLRSLEWRKWLRGFVLCFYEGFC